MAECILVTKARRAPVGMTRMRRKFSTFSAKTWVRGYNVMYHSMYTMIVYSAKARDTSANNYLICIHNSQNLIKNFIHKVKEPLSILPLIHARDSMLVLTGNFCLPVMLRFLAQIKLL